MTFNKFSVNGLYKDPELINRHPRLVKNRAVGSRSHMLAISLHIATANLLLQRYPAGFSARQFLFANRTVNCAGVNINDDFVTTLHEAPVTAPVPTRGPEENIILLYKMSGLANLFADIISNDNILSFLGK